MGIIYTINAEWPPPPENRNVLLIYCVLGMRYTGNINYKNIQNKVAIKIMSMQKSWYLCSMSYTFCIFIWLLCPISQVWQERLLQLKFASFAVFIDAILMIPTPTCFLENKNLKDALPKINIIFARFFFCSRCDYSFCLTCRIKVFVIDPYSEI